MNQIRLNWTDPVPPTRDGCPYDHVSAETPFGPIRITWKSWKEYDAPCVDVHPVPDFFYAGHDLEDAQREAERVFFSAVEQSNLIKI